MKDELWQREGPDSLLANHEAPELPVALGMLWYAMEDQASAIRVEPKTDGAVIQFRINNRFKDMCEIDQKMLKPLLQRVDLMIPPDNTTPMNINDVRCRVSCHKVTVDAGERVTLEIRHESVKR